MNQSSNQTKSVGKTMVLVVRDSYINILYRHIYMPHIEFPYYIWYKQIKHHHQAHMSSNSYIHTHTYIHLYVYVYTHTCVWIYKTVFSCHVNLASQIFKKEHTFINSNVLRWKINSHDDGETMICTVLQTLLMVEVHISPHLPLL